MIDVKETLTGATERMEMAAMYLEEQLASVPDAPMWLSSTE